MLGIARGGYRGVVVKGRKHTETGFGREGWVILDINRREITYLNVHKLLMTL